MRNRIQERKWRRNDVDLRRISRRSSVKYSFLTREVDEKSTSGREIELLINGDLSDKRPRKFLGQVNVKKSMSCFISSCNSLGGVHDPIRDTSNSLSSWGLPGPWNESRSSTSHPCVARRSGFRHLTEYYCEEDRFMPWACVWTLYRCGVLGFKSYVLALHIALHLYAPRSTWSTQHLSWLGRELWFRSLFSSKESERVGIMIPEAGFRDEDEILVVGWGRKAKEASGTMMQKSEVSAIFQETSTAGTRVFFIRSERDLCSCVLLNKSLAFVIWGPPSKNVQISSADPPLYVHID